MTQMPEFVSAAIGLAIAFSCICRAVKTGPETVAPIRWALSLHAACGFGLALIPHFSPHLYVWCLVSVAASSALLMLATARAWKSGVPVGYTISPNDTIALRDMEGAAKFGRRASDRMPLGEPEIEPAPWQRWNQGG